MHAVTLTECITQFQRTDILLYVPFKGPVFVSVFPFVNFRSIKRMFDIKNTYDSKTSVKCLVQ